MHKTTTTDDKRLQSTLKRIGVNAIPAIEEVNIFKDDVVIQFVNPKGDCNLIILRQALVILSLCLFLVINIVMILLLCFSSSVNCC